MAGLTHQTNQPMHSWLADRLVRQRGHQRRTCLPKLTEPLQQGFLPSIEWDIHQLLVEIVKSFIMPQA